MAAVDVGLWKEFRVGDLFEIYRGKRHPVNDHTEGEIPYYAASLDNNGITDRIGNPIFTDENALVITIFGDAFWASGEFTACDDCTVLKHANMSELSGLFVASAYMAANKDKYSFSLKAFSGRISEDTLKLPATDDGQPDWAYMEAYMGSVMERQAAVVDALSRMATEKRPVDVGSWKEFRVGDLFECNTTLSVVSKTDLVDGSINYITRSAVDNGLSGTCGNEDQINSGDCITIGAEGFVAFWQKDDFVAGNKVYSIRHECMNELSGLFVCAALNTLSSQYSFSDARVLDRIKDEAIKLPATPDDDPDWAFMESYMAQVMERQERVVEHLGKICGKQ